MEEKISPVSQAEPEGRFKLRSLKGIAYAATPTAFYRCAVES